MSLSGLRILIVSPGYPRWKGDFTHPMVFNLARLLRGGGARPSVVTIHYPGVPQQEEMDGVEVIRARYAADRYEVMGSEGGLVDDIRGSWLCKLLLLPMLASLAWQTFWAARRADLILVQWIPTAVVALPAKLLLGKKLILQSRTYPDTPFWRRVYGFLLRFADGVIYNSADNRRLTDGVYRHPNACVIGSGINLRQFEAPTNREPSEVAGPFQVLSVSRLVEFKGIEYAIRAMRILKDRGRRVRFVVYGEGPLRQPLERLVEELGVGAEVLLPGAIQHAQVPEKMWESDLFLLSSIIDSKGRTEGFGAVILEAMAARIPVVASAVGGITDIVNSDNGILVPEKDATEIADAIERVMADSALAENLALRAQSFVMEKYSDEAVVGLYERIFTATAA